MFDPNHFWKPLFARSILKAFSALWANSKDFQVIRNPNFGFRISNFQRNSPGNFNRSSYCWVCGLRRLVDLAAAYLVQATHPLGPTVWVNNKESILDQQFWSETFGGSDSRTKAKWTAEDLATAKFCRMVKMSANHADTPDLVGLSPAKLRILPQDSTKAQKKKPCHSVVVFSKNLICFSVAGGSIQANRWLPTSGQAQYDRPQDLASNLLLSRRQNLKIIDFVRFEFSFVSARRPTTGGPLKRSPCALLN